VNFGLLATAESGEEIAGVLAHELHHVILRHGVTRLLSRVGGFTMIGLLLGWTNLHSLVNLAGDLTQLAYDRDQERAADERGETLLAEANIDPRGLATFFSRLKREHGDLPPILSSHPGFEERIRTAAALPVPANTRKLPSPNGLSCR